MAVGRVNKTSIDASYHDISAHVAEIGVGHAIESYLTLLFTISQAEEVTDVADFFSGRNLPITESFEGLNASYELIKMGLHKQSFICLRVGLDNGLIAAYWKSIGDKTVEFRRWLRSKDETPRKSKQFWQSILSIPAVGEFCARFPLRQEIDGLEELSDYVHTRGASYATFTDFQRQVQSGNRYVHFDKWWIAFRAVSRVVIALQLLVNPKLAVTIPDDMLLRKFGTYSKIPFMGILIGDYREKIKSLLGDAEYEAIVAMANKSAVVESLNDYIRGRPDLSQDEIHKLIFQEQKHQVLDIGFAKWLENRHLYDHRNDERMVLDIQSWIEGEKADG